MKTELDKIYGNIRSILEDARSNAYRAVNFAMVQAYWQIGCLIVEQEQEGKKRAEYGKQVLKELSKRLTEGFGKGFDERNLRSMRQFYLYFSNQNIGVDGKWSAVRTISKNDEPIESEESRKRNAVRSRLVDCNKELLLRHELSWTHYRSILKVEDETAREWYMNEAADQQWSTRELDRQISTLYYERLLSSKDKELVKEEAEEKFSELDTQEFIRDPYVLEFLNLKDFFFC